MWGQGVCECGYVGEWVGSVCECVSVWGGMCVCVWVSGCLGGCNRERGYGTI